MPFCVLDEVEAALDEANVSRFAEYLREFSEMTQFIVVTHRKGTMEEADVLYGVTMQEGGVSKLVSVRLEDEEAYRNDQLRNGIIYEPLMHTCSFCKYRRRHHEFF